MTLVASEALQRVRAVPLARWIFLKTSFSRGDATTAAATILRLSSESKDDIVLMIPPWGLPAGALHLSEALRTAGTAPVLGVISADAFHPAIVTLQGCAIRLSCRGTTVSLDGAAEETYKAKTILSGEESEEWTRALGDLENSFFELQRAHTLRMELFVSRTGQTLEQVSRACAEETMPLEELLADGWIDAII